MLVARRTAFLFLVLLLSAGTLAAQDKLLTLDDIYHPRNRVNFSGNPPTRLQWLADGVHYLYPKSERGDRPQSPADWLKVNALTGESAPFFDTGKMESALAKLPGVSREDARRLSRLGRYQMNGERTAVVLNHARDLFYYEFGAERAVRLTSTPEEESVEEFSPDGRMVSFVRGNNLYIVDVGTQRERALTNDPDPKLLNGKLDWVYQEELYGRGNFKGHWWSPDSSAIAYLQLDQHPVHEFTIVDHVPDLLEVEKLHYPKAGDPNPKVRLGIVSAAGGAARWVEDTRYANTDFLIVRVDWTPDSKNVVWQAQDREQTWLDLNASGARDGKTNRWLHETTKAWVSVLGDPKWLKDGSFLWQSERSGYQHIYHYEAGGKLLRQVTEGKWEVRSLYGVDEDAGWVYFSSNAHSPIANHTYRVKLDGTGLARLTQDEGSHTSLFNPQHTRFIDNWSDASTPTKVRLHSADGALVRVIDENNVVALKQYRLSRPEFLQVKTRDGFVMEAMLIRPPDFDAKKKYPVMSFTYSGPSSQSVRNAWTSQTAMWYQLLAQKGYLIWVCDNRTASGKGIEPTWEGYQRMGELELRDLEDGLAWLKKQPGVDGARIGLHGWSYGGFMTSFALTHSKSFKMGIAGAPVTDWRLYDSIYTERYMRTPQNNPDGYKKTAPVNAAKDLHGKLLLIHGTVDDNVHMQNTIQFVYELQKAGKQFDLMLYPKSRHGITDPQLSLHLRTLMTEYILKNL